MLDRYWLLVTEDDKSNRASAPSALCYLIIQSMRNHQTRLGCWGLALLYIWPGIIQCTRETTLEGEEDREEKKDDYVAYQKKEKDAWNKTINKSLYPSVHPN